MVPNSVYFHISNSGVTFSVKDDGFGPTLHVEAGAFGHKLAHTQVSMTVDGLALLGRWLTEQSKRTFSEQYCHAAEPYGEEVKELLEHIGVASNDIHDAVKP